LDARNARLFLKSLVEDGVEELYLPPRKAAPPAPVAASAPAAASKPSAAVSACANDKFSVLRPEVMKCMQCPDLVANRRNIVFGTGSPDAELVFVGEAPGRDEDEQGEPFVGAAGQLLTKIIEAMHFKRDQVYICNVLKCRPPGNRPPKPQEVLNCRPFLKRQLELLKPKIIVALGNFAAQSLLETDEGISRLRGRFLEYEGIKVMCTYHPAYLLRSPGEKGKVWSDMKLVMAELEAMRS